MATINIKTLQDLEFETVLQSVSNFCTTEQGKEQALLIGPFSSEQETLISLRQTSEYVSSFTNNNIIPNHYFDNIDYELKFLKIEDSFLEASSFKKIYSLCETCIALLEYLKKFESYYPNIYHDAKQITLEKQLLKSIDQIIDKYGEIKDNASVDLLSIRRNINIVRGKINQSFGFALTQYNNAGYLDDIRETVVENRRVLAVSAMHRRKVKGSVLGQSKTGSIIYIEPEVTLQFSRELNNLEYEQREEIVRILKNLTNIIRNYTPVLKQYRDFLVHIDITSGKAKYANKINALLPNITKERELYFKEAFHPILLLNNKAKRKPTFAQTIKLDEQGRIIVISGPNAGGKSITLKTIGLLQLMLQCGLLIPVDQRSSTFLFDRILTDIGDNQSIENHLSTYSYRLKNMQYFLKKCNENTLFLIDEFGTGSDPELGGALAEVFLEEFYQRKAFGIITTHYTNLKILADELPNATNANMLFDEKTLEPLYKLNVGQAGSSFTFEVAQKNGIPFSLINRAKKKVESDKVRFDKTIANLQKERHKLERTSNNLKEEESKAREESLKMQDINAKIQDKLYRYQELFDSNQKLVYLGQKLEDLSVKYFNNKSKKTLFGEVLKVVEIENSKRKQQTVKQQKAKEVEQKVILAEVEKKIEKIREDKKQEKIKKNQQDQNKPKIPLKVGDRVRMIEGRAVGSIDSIEKNKATVNYGMFTSKVSLDQLELVQRMK